MALHTATVAWARGDARFTDHRYSRAHRWRFDGGAEVAAAASPHVVPPALTDAAAVDPEGAFVAALAACHMLWFLALAARRGLVVDAYEDHAEGVLAPDASGQLAMTAVTLRPRVRYAGAPLDAAAEAALHHAAHEACFLARSVRTAITIEAAA